MWGRSSDAVAVRISLLGCDAVYFDSYRRIIGSCCRCLLARIATDLLWRWRYSIFPTCRYVCTTLRIITPHKIVILPSLVERSRLQVSARSQAFVTGANGFLVLRTNDVLSSASFSAISDQSFRHCWKLQYMNKKSVNNNNNNCYYSYYYYYYYYYYLLQLGFLPVAVVLH